MACPHRGLPESWQVALGKWDVHMMMRGLSPVTRRVRGEQVRYIAKTSATPGPADISRDDLLNLCSRPSWSPAYRKAIREAMRSFYGYCASVGLAEDISGELPAVKPPTPRPRATTDAIWDELLSKAPPRERLIARLAAEAGLRRAEVACLKHDDLTNDGHGWALIVRRGKGDKQRIVPITDTLAADIRAWCASGYLFPGREDGHLSVVYVGHLISNLMPAGYSIHSLRHRFSSRGYAATRDIRALQEVLGHASVATTQRYTPSSRDDMRRVSEAASAPTNHDGPVSSQ